MTSIRTTIAIALFAAATAAQAQWYGYLQLGSADAQTTNVSGREPALGFGAGYQFNKYLAVEALYLDLTHYEAMAGSTAFRWSANGLGAMAVGTLPLGQSWRLVGKAGVYALTTTETEAVGSFTLRSDEHSITAPAFALGVDYHLLDTARARLLFERIDGDKELDRIEQVTLGVVVGF